MKREARNGAPQNRDRYEHGVWNDPGSAAQRFALHLARETAAGDSTPGSAPR
jgi:hypothetical protein